MFLNIINDWSWYPLHPLDDDITVASSAESSNMAVRMSKDTLLPAEQLLSANKLFLNATKTDTTVFPTRNGDMEVTALRWNAISNCVVIYPYSEA